MTMVGAFEAKTHLSTLLQEVAGGEEVLITRHGKPLRLVPVESGLRERRLEAIDRLRSFATGHRLNGLSVSQLREEGRRW